MKTCMIKEVGKGILKLLLVIGAALLIMILFMLLCQGIGYSLVHGLGICMPLEAETPAGYYATSGVFVIFILAILAFIGLLLYSTREWYIDIKHKCERIHND
jgi:hypothetical protein